MGYSFRLTARVLLYPQSHRQDSRYHGFCYTSCGALVGTRNRSMGPSHEGSIRRPIAPWENTMTCIYMYIYIFIYLFIYLFIYFGPVTPTVILLDNYRSLYIFLLATLKKYSGFSIFDICPVTQTVQHLKNT